MSRLVGRMMHWKLPPFFVRAFAWYYHINLSEAEHRLEQYPSIGQFFTRKLKHGARPIAQAWAVHPCDSEILQHGPIVDGTLIQAKGHNYRLLELTEDPHCMEKYGDGVFITYYLCPTDYHRVHSPVHGFIRSVMYKNGDLWPVNKASVRSVPQLYVANERVVVEIATEHGAVGVVMVGATNVGSMSLCFDPAIRTNRGQKSKRHDYREPIEINKGDELGIFHMGSTVILLLSADFRKNFWTQINTPKRVQVGQAMFGEKTASASSGRNHSAESKL